VPLHTWLCSSDCYVTAFAGEALAFLFEKLFTTKLAAHDAARMACLNSNKGGGGGWAERSVPLWPSASGLSVGSSRSSGGRAGRTGDQWELVSTAPPPRILEEAEAEGSGRHTGRPCTCSAAVEIVHQVYLRWLHYPSVRVTLEVVMDELGGVHSHGDALRGGAPTRGHRSPAGCTGALPMEPPGTLRGVPGHP
jgi:hypothetical protein